MSIFFSNKHSFIMSPHETTWACECFSGGKVSILDAVRLTDLIPLYDNVRIKLSVVPKKYRCITKRFTPVLSYPSVNQFCPAALSIYLAHAQSLSSGIVTSWLHVSSWIISSPTIYKWNPSDHLSFLCVFFLGDWYTFFNINTKSSLIGTFENPVSV